MRRHGTFLIGGKIMFCRNCGQKLEDGSTFCTNCGAPVSGENAAPVNNSQAVQPNNAVNYQPSNVGAAQPKQRKKLGTGAVVAIVVAVAVVIIAAVVVFFLFFYKGGNSGSSGQSSNIGGIFGQSSGNSGSSQPVQTGQPVLTVNGENIPLELSGFAYAEVDMGDYGYAAVFIGRKGTELYSVQALFLTDEDPTCPSANTTYDTLSSKYEDTVAVQFNYMDSSKGTEIYAASYDGGFDRAEIIVGDFKPNEKMVISINGKASEDGLTFDFSASGNPEFYHDPEKLSDKIDSIVKSVRNSGNSSSSSSKPSSTSTPKEVEIAGETYPVSTTFLDLSNKGLRDSDIKNIKYLKNLTRAELSGNNLTDISVLQSITSLEEIDAKDNNISDISFMKKLPNLKIVVMNNNPIKDISVFSNFSTIEKIWLNDTYVTDISPISKNKGMTELGFDNCNIKDISAIKGMKKLEMLSVNNCGITDISALSTCTGLNWLSITDNKIKDWSPIDKLNIAELYRD